VLTHRDNYRVKVESRAETHPVWLYVFQKDEKENIDRLFPNPVWNAEKTNPLSPDSFSLFIPPDKSGWMYLDELSPENLGHVPEETLFMIASPWKAQDIEDLYGELSKETDRAKRMELVDRFVLHLEKRKDAGIPSVVCQKISFKHGE